MAEKKKRERTPAQKAAQFQKGVSGNPAGRTPDPENVKEYSKQFTRKAIDALVNIIDTSNNPTAVVNASNSILNRAWGQPKQSMDIDVVHKHETSDLITMLLQRRAEQEKALAEREEPLVIEAELVEKSENDAN